MQLSGDGAFGPPRDRDEAVLVLQAAVRAGVDHIDTAQFYGSGTVNQLIREALHPYPEGLAIVSKVVARTDGTHHLRAGIEDNLTTLDTGRLAAVNLRMIDPSQAAGRQFDAQLAVLAQARDEGLIDGIGLSNISRSHLLRAVEQTEIVCVQNLFNLADQRSIEVLTECEARDIAFVPYCPLGLPGEQRRRLLTDRRLSRLAARLGATAGSSRARMAARPRAEHSPDPGHPQPRPPRREPRRRQRPARRHRARRAVPLVPNQPTERRSSVSTEQRETLDAILRQSAFPVGSDITEQRRLLRELLSAQPLPADVTVTAGVSGGVPTAEITVDGIEPRHVVLYFHGGVYVMGDAFLAADLASQVGRRTHAKVISVDYRLAPEHPYPAAVDDALAAYEALLHNGVAPADVAFAGESAGGGLAVATLVNARDRGLPLPAAAFVMSPYADLTLAGTTIDTKRRLDPLLSREALQARIPDYAAGHDAALGLISPVFADLSGLPPLIIQAGTHEVLLDDAVRLAQEAVTADVEVILDITPGVPHVFQAYHPILDEAGAALDRAGQFLSAHLAGAGRVAA